MRPVFLLLLLLNLIPSDVASKPLSSFSLPVRFKRETANPHQAYLRTCLPPPSPAKLTPASTSVATSLKGGDLGASVSDPFGISSSARLHVRCLRKLRSLLPLQLKPLPPIIQRLLLAAATVPSLPIVFPRLAKAAMDKSGSTKSLLSQAATMIGISGVSPAVLGVVATLLRGLQLTTPLRNIFNPTAGVAAGVSVGGAVIDRQWVGLMVACWVGSEPLWRLLGA